MAFNFNWSPLTADEDFYERARDLLTTALNKSPKPPIIVDDILVTELNLGSVPPELEILEIGDLAEDRFRGIFKMCYSGDAFLTLRTRVQVRDVTSRFDFSASQSIPPSGAVSIPPRRMHASNHIQILLRGRRVRWPLLDGDRFTKPDHSRVGDLNITGYVIGGQQEGDHLCGSSSSPRQVSATSPHLVGLPAHMSFPILSPSQCVIRDDSWTFPCFSLGPTQLALMH